MLKQIIVVFFLLITGVVVSQEGTTSPYSYYGIGTIKFKGTAENRSMGGISILSDSIHLNLSNPAGVADLRLINYTIGASHKRTSFETESQQASASATSVDYLAIGVPMGKFGASFGLIPTTSVGYQIESSSDDVVTRYSGSGGLNKVFFNLGYKITDAFNVGVDVNYNFGNIENTTYSQRIGSLLGAQEFLRSELSGFSFNFGATYKKMVTDDLQLASAFTYVPETDFKSVNQKEVATVLSIPTGGVRPIDLRSVDVADTEFTFPSKVTLGLGIGKPKNWFVGAEYASLKTSNLNDQTNTAEQFSYEDASSFKLGGFFIPDYNSVVNFWNRVVYRGGIRYEETGIVLNGEQINEFGISFGVGLPVGRLFSNANLGFELGRRGTKDFGLVQENFFNTFLSLSLNDKWFEKRYYD